MTQIKDIFIASDHAGFEYKTKLIAFLKAEYSITITDLGCSSEASVDYPVYGRLVAEHIKTPDQFGILICGSGIGVSIAANRFKHIRAALCHTVEYAKLARLHNDANVLALGSRMLTLHETQDIIKVFLETDFEKGRHEKRVNQLSNF